MRSGGARFFFYSLEGTEPPHIHVEQGGATAKFWIDPVDSASSRGFRAHELRRLRLVVMEHRLRRRRGWRLIGRGQGVHWPDIAAATLLRAA